MAKYDFIYVFFKVGDQETAKDKEYLGMKDGMPVCWIDPNDWNPVISDDMQKIFACVKVPLSWKSIIIDSVKPNQYDEHIDPKTYRARKKLINFDDLQTDTGISNLVDNLRAKGVKVPIIDGKNLPEYIFKDSDNLNSPAIDNNAITSGSANVGSGETYTTWGLAFADLGNLTDDLTFTQTSDTTETVSSQATINLGGHTFLCSSNTPHNGDPTNGWLINVNGDTVLFDLRQEGPGITEMKNLYIKQLSEGATSSYVITTGVVTGFTLKFHDNLMNGDGKSNGSLFTSFDAQVIVQNWNNVFWNMDAAGGRGFRLLALNGSDIYENNTIYNCNIGVENGNLAVTYINFLFIDNATNIASNTNSISESCATDAADVGAATNNNDEVSITVADEIYSTDDTSPLFMKSRAAGVIHDGGAAASIAGNTTGIRGNPRPHDA